MKYIIKYILRLFFYPFKYIIPKNNTIIISSNSAYNYSGNAKYLFEYLSINEEEFTQASKMFEHPMMTKEYFINLCDSFRSPHIWKREGGDWLLRESVFNSN